MSENGSAEKIKAEWLTRLRELMDKVRQWAEDSGWATREIEFTLKDRRIGDHRVPALLMQESAVKLMLEPVGALTPGASGMVDLYQMPAYDDVASFYYSDGQWKLHWPGHSAPNEDGVEVLPVTKDAFSRVLTEMLAHAA